MATSTYYAPGQELHVRFTPWVFPTAGPGHRASFERESPNARGLVFDIVRIFSPSTLSAVLCIKLKQPHDPGERLAGDGDSTPLWPDKTYILKLFDRRCMNNLRELWPYTDALEAEYQQYLARPDRVPVPCTQWGPDCEAYDAKDARAVNEEYIDWFSARSLKHELEIYHRLMLDPSKRSLFPHFYGSVETESDIGPVRGLLVEHVYPSVTLSRFVTEAAPCGYLSQKVERLCQQALDTLGQLNNEYILNDDVRYDNILVRLSKEWPATASGICPADIEATGCVFIDFGDARLRKPDETDSEWWSAKELVAESGMITSEAGQRFKEAGETDCPYHDTLCRVTDSPPDDGGFRQRVGALMLLVPYLENDPFRAII